MLIRPAAIAIKAKFINHTDRFSRGFAFFEGNLSSTRKRKIGAIKKSMIGFRTNR